MEDDESGNEELIVTNFTEFRNYIGNRIIKKNWESLKKYFKYRKDRLCNCCICVRCRKKVDVSLEPNVTETETDKNKLQLQLQPNALQKTKIYIQTQRRIRHLSLIEDALEYYVKQICKLNEKKADFEFIDELLNEGININYISKFYENALFQAIRSENEDLIQYLIDKEINLFQVNTNGCNVFHIAATTEVPNIIRRLALKLEPSELERMLGQRTTDNQQTPLHYAAREGSCAVAECFINEYNVDKEAIDYKNRTPLFIAAEFNRKNMVKLLMELDCCVSFTDKTRKHVLSNHKGQTPLYWIVTKMPDIAKEALDQLYEPNPYLRKDKHYLAPLEPKIVENSNKNETLPKSVLASIVESSNLDLIVHPTINCLIDIKWKNFARKRAWLDFFLTIVYVAVWITFGVWVPNSSRHVYDFSTSEDRFRLCLFIIGILFTVYLIITEISEVYNEYKYQQKSNKIRQKELQEYKEKIDQKNEKNHFIKEEEALIKLNNKYNVIKNYFFDLWNLYDWASIILLLACIGTHVDDVIDHDECKSRLHIRIMSVTIIIISLRLLKSSRILIPQFGTLVMILYYTISDMIIWFILYLVIWLSFSCSFWMIYGGTDKIANENDECFEVTDNRTIVSVDQFKTYDLTAYSLYRLTFGESFDESELNQIDDTMLNPLLGSYVGITSLVLANIFIALLSATFQRVYEKAESYIVLQRGIEILNKEKSMSIEQRRDHVKYINKIGSPYIDNRYNETITSLEDRVSNLEKEAKEHNKLLTNISSSFDSTNSATKNLVTLNIERVSKLQNEIKDLKETLTKFLEVQSIILSDINNTAAANTPREPKFDFLNYREFINNSNINLKD